MSDTLIALKDCTILRKGVEKPELEHFSLAIERSEIVSLVGESVPGKDALMRFLAGVPQRDEIVTGEIRLGTSAAHSAERRIESPLRLAFLPGPSARPLSASATAASQLVRIVARKTNLPIESARVELAMALERLPGAPRLAELERRPIGLAPELLAWGLLGCAVATGPELILADRTFVGLPPTVTRALVRALLGEQKRIGFALLYNALGTDVARWLGGRMMVIRHGHIVEEGPVAQLAAGQSHAYTRTLLSASDVSAQRPHAPALRGQAVIQAFGLPLAGGEKLTFALRRGGALAFLGEGGSGARAVMRKLIGLERSQAGRIVFDAVDIGVLSKGMMARMRRRIALIAGRDDVLDDRLTVFDTVVEPLQTSLRLTHDLEAGYRDAALKRVGLSALKGDLPVARLSPFDRRRLQVARAIAGAPILAVLDEPFHGLDAFAQSVMRDLLQGFRMDDGPAFLVLTADATVARTLADDVMVFRDGTVVERGSVTEILQKPRDSYTRALIDAAGPLV